jgi:hypothetical protein
MNEHCNIKDFKNFSFRYASDIDSMSIYASRIYSTHH